jgi:ABC-2 type transport system permease protein
MTASGSLIWFARHEVLLAWRDTLSMMTAGRRDREGKVAIGLIILAGFMHVVAFLTLGSLRDFGLNRLNPDLPVLIAITAGVLLSASAMLSQAMENVTRVFYTRSDLELILRLRRGHRNFAHSDRVSRYP